MARVALQLTLVIKEPVRIQLVSAKQHPATRLSWREPLRKVQAAVFR